MGHPRFLDGSNPYAGLIRDAAGNLYGTTYSGAGNADYDNGTVFKVGTEGVEKVLHSFGCNVVKGGIEDCLDGSNPYAGLIRDAAGNLYGTTYSGAGNADYDNGTVFKVSAEGVEKVLYSFCSENVPEGLRCTDGEYPYAGLIRDAAGNLYGTTHIGGADVNIHSGYGGTVFELGPKGVEKVLYSFCAVFCNEYAGPDPDGEFPYAGLIRDAAGNFYGTTASGGAYKGGTVFKLDTAGNETVLYNFCSAAGCADGASPVAGLIQDAAGNLYGTTASGGAHNGGTVFKLTVLKP